MIKHNSQILLIGKNSSFNNTIAEIVGSQQDLIITHLEDLHQLEIYSLIPDAIITNLITLNGESKAILHSIKLKFPDCPVLALHYHTDSMIIEGILRAGADKYMSQDVTEDDLLSTLRSLAHQS